MHVTEHHRYFMKEIYAFMKGNIIQVWFSFLGIEINILVYGKQFGAQIKCWPH
jgi:hypothetical protein